MVHTSTSGRRLAGLIAFAAFVGAARCPAGSGETVQGRHVGTFHSLSVSRGVYTEAKLDSWPEVNVFAYANVADNILTEVLDGELSVTAREGTCVAETTVQMSTLLPLTSVTATGDGSLVVEAVRRDVRAIGGSRILVGSLNGSVDAILRASGHGSSVRVGQLTLDGALRLLVEGEADVSVVEGHASAVHILANGSASVDLSGLVAERVQVVADGASIVLPSAAVVTGSCSGSGQLVVKGRPEVSVTKTGSCRVVRGGRRLAIAKRANATTAETPAVTEVVTAMETTAVEAMTAPSAAQPRGGVALALAATAACWLACFGRGAP